MLLFRTRRGLAIALAISDVFAEGSDLESLQAKNARAPLEGDEAATFKKLLSASAYISAFSLASYLFQLIDSDGEALNDTPEPDFLFDTPQDAVKSIVSGLDRAISGAKDDADLMTRGAPLPVSPSTGFWRERAASTASARSRTRISASTSTTLPWMASTSRRASGRSRW